MEDSQYVYLSLIHIWHIGTELNNKAETVLLVENYAPQERKADVYKRQEDDNPGALAEGKIFNIYTMMRNFNITAGTPAFARCV